MKILLVSPQYDPESGGCSRLLQDIAGGLAARGHEIEVLTYGDPALPALAAFDRAQAYPIRRVAPQRLPGASSARMALRLVSSARRFDLVLCGVAFPTAILAATARALTGTPYAVYSHGEDVTVVQGTRLRRALVSAALRGARAVMTNSGFTRHEVLSLGVSPETVYWVPPCVRPEEFAAAREVEVARLRERYGLGGKRVILTVARLQARKGQDTMIRALAALRRADPDLHYLVVGKGDTAGLRALAEAEGVTEAVTFAGYVADEDLPAHYHLCDVCAMVSRWDPAVKETEGFGIVYLEAAACGKPCVAGSDGGAADAVEDGVTGLVVDPHSDKAVQGALRALLGDPDRAAGFGRAGRRRVRNLFDSADLAGRVENILRAARPAASAAPLAAQGDCP